MLIYNPMLTSDDLKKFKGVIREESDTLEKKLRKIIREEVDKRAEETELKMELRFNSVDKHFEKLEEQMKEDRKDWSQFFNDAGIFFDEMRNQMMNRIKKVEDNQRLSNN